jgi:hypothetical protein
MFDEICMEPQLSNANIGLGSDLALLLVKDFLRHSGYLNTLKALEKP